MVGFRTIFERIVNTGDGGLTVEPTPDKGPSSSLSKDVINERNGFNIAFSNGLMVSVQFGSHMHCVAKKDKNGFKKNAEIAVIKGKRFVTKEYVEDCGGDDVKGYVTPEELADVIFRVGRNIKIDGRSAW